jgi:hypothetical protein
MSSPRTNLFRQALLSGLPLIVLAFAAMASERIHLTPKFSAGETFRYSIESRTTSTGKTTAPIVNPEGGSRSSQSVRMVVRLDVLSVSPAGQVHLRATYEKSSAQSESDALDLQAASFADQFNRLEGSSFEFTIEPGGNFADAQVLTPAPAAPSPPQPALSFLQGLPTGAGFPQKGIAIGQKWTTERPIAGALLSGLIWRAESTYLRDEECGSSANSKSGADPSRPSPAAGASQCAVILTRSELLRRGSTQSDATPDEYRRNGLRTSGTWTGSGESLDSISLSTGLLVASTQSSTQSMDYLITSASNGSNIHHVGKAESQSEISLVPDQP